MVQNNASMRSNRAHPKKATQNVTTCSSWRANAVSLLYRYVGTDADHWQTRGTAYGQHRGGSGGTFHMHSELNAVPMRVHGCPTATAKSAAPHHHSCSPRWLGCLLIPHSPSLSTSDLSPQREDTKECKELSACAAMPIPAAQMNTATVSRCCQATDEVLMALQGSMSPTSIKCCIT